MKTSKVDSKDHELQVMLAQPDNIHTVCKIYLMNLNDTLILHRISFYIHHHMPSRCDTLLTTIFDRFSTRLLILLAGWTKTASLIPIPSGKDSAKTLRVTKWRDLMVWDQSFSMLQNVTYQRDNFIVCFLVSVPFPMSILDSFGCLSLLRLISFRMFWICMNISLTFQLCLEVIEAPGQDPRTLCALWSGTGEEDHNRKTKGRHPRNTIFLQVLPDRAFHSSWPMLIFVSIQKFLVVHVSVNFPES